VADTITISEANNMPETLAGTAELR